MPTAPDLSGVHHVALTVTDLERSAQWYATAFGFEPAAPTTTADFDALVLRHPTGLRLKLMTHHSGSGGGFDERRPGLDHLAFAVDSAEAVAEFAGWLDAQGIEHSGVTAGSLPGSRLVVVRDPDGVQLECYYG